MQCGEFLITFLAWESLLSIPFQGLRRDGVQRQHDGPLDYAVRQGIHLADYLRVGSGRPQIDSSHGRGLQSGRRLSRQIHRAAGALRTQVPGSENGRFRRDNALHGETDEENGGNSAAGHGGPHPSQLRRTHGLLVRGGQRDLPVRLSHTHTSTGQSGGGLPRAYRFGWTKAVGATGKTGPFDAANVLPD